jgi:hypothetical protein
MKVYRPDTEEFVSSTATDFTPKIFLAGSIEMGKAEDWQTELINKLKDKDIIIFNPRRADWDPTWEQKKENPEFYNQVTWELEHLELADWIVLYLDPNTKSPITLLELGIHAQANKLIVCCPKVSIEKEILTLLVNIMVSLVPITKRISLTIKFFNY